ncbi:DUF2339 domain-containing protein [Pleomorphomonas diazotrophica]|uniref:DUF2339 domain-containing protein n=1 Tax=Pleomorphomonas diazotrophica TaxID=1166257 RepID=A0A1I4WDQ3_9HYPH|nr:DUF2339 domain-containing protein [Pleomorphomonas diazotrophica]PKR89003.1 DUF2339 domain-containing protein [Pleomorphomonas diazotrophica]SFN11527.1 Uncharacterized membrane protein [Pleomorphomonas diazotrophica]
MDELLLFAALIVLTILAGSVLGIVAFSRTQELRRRIEQLEAALRAPRRIEPMAEPPLTEARPAASAPDEEIVEAEEEVAASEAAPEPLDEAESADDPAQPEPEQPPLAARDSLEEKIGSRWAVWVGGLALGLGGIFLVRYSIEAGLLGPAARVLLGLVFSALLLAGGEWLRRSGFAEADGPARRAYIPGVLAAAGAVSAFASVYAAYGLYGLIGPAFAFVALGAVGVATLVLALRHGPALAALGLLAAYVTPLLVSSTEPALLPLILYLAVVTAATYGVARLRLWRWLAISATVANILWSLLLSATVGTVGHGADQLYIAAHFLISLLLAAVVFVTSHAPRDRTADAAFDRTAAGVLSLFTLPLLAFVAAAGTQPLTVGLIVIFAALLMALASEWPAARGLAVTALVTTLLAYGLLNVTVSNVVIDPVTGQPTVPGFADLLASPAGSDYLGIGILLGVILTVAGLAGTIASRGRPQLAIAGAFAPTGLIAIAYLNTSLDLAASPAFAVAALVAAIYLGSVTEYLGRRLASDARGRDGAIAAYAVGCVAALGAALTIALERGMLTVSLALLVAAIAWVEARRPVVALRPTALAVAAVVIARVAWDPRIVGDDLGTTVLFNPLLYGYGVPTLAFAYAAWRFGRTPGDPRYVPVFEALAVIFTALTATVEVHHAMNGGDMFAPVSSLAEQSLLSMVMMAISLGLNWVGARRPSPVMIWGVPLFGGFGLVMAAIGLLIVNNPIFSGEPIDGGAFDGTLLLGYFGPAVMALLIAGLARRRKDLPPYAVTIAATVGGLLAAMWATLAVRAGWHTGNLGWGGVEEGELYAYSAVWLTLGLVVLGIGFATASRTVRTVAAVIVAGVVAKVFLIDTAGLTGALRALSFIGLGGVLVAIGLAYQTVLRRRRSGLSGG